MARQVAGQTTLKTAELIGFEQNHNPLWHLQKMVQKEVAIVWS